jgi:DNA-directed RNA polymerase subunit RPC12/RpoP
VSPIIHAFRFQRCLQRELAMPIRFRCVYCDKLLGIGRRKAGAIVNCPHCGEKLIVPTPEPEDATSEPHDLLEAAREEAEERALAGADGPQLFERSDFEALLQPEPTFRSTENDRPAASAKATRPKFESVPAPPFEPIPNVRDQPAAQAPAPVEDRRPAGIYISPSKATVLSVIAVLLLAAAFAGGLLVGRLLKAS